jgi:hypothetical protein
MAGSKGEPMKARIVNICLATALIVAGYMWGHSSATVVYAQTRNATIPKAWGRVVGTMATALVLEDSAGTIRVVRSDTGHLEVQVSRN